MVRRRSLMSSPAPSQKRFGPMGLSSNTSILTLSCVTSIPSQSNHISPCLPCLFQVSKMSSIRRTSALIPSPASYVRACLSKIGFPCGAAFTGRPGTLTAFWSHALLDYAIHVVGLKTRLIAYTHSLHKDIRRRALRKQEREAKKE